MTICPFLQEGKFKGVDLDTEEEKIFRYRCLLKGTVAHHPLALCPDINNPEKCQLFRRKMVILNLKMPLTCPLWREGEGKGKGCEITEKWCDFGCPYEFRIDEEDYRTCEIFSKWFWEQLIKEKVKR